MAKLGYQTLLDEARFGRLHWKVLFWCALIIIFDGYDLVVYGVVLPVLMKEWGMSAIQAGSLGSYALFGMMIGALVFGPLSDRIGRRRTIMTCVVLFSAFTVLNGFARGPLEFGLCRFLAGLGIGGVMPNVVALMTEYSPKRMRSLLVAIMFSGYSVGGMLSAGIGIVMLPKFGWQSVFFVAIVPLLLLPLIIRALPESVGFLLKTGKTDRARGILQRIRPDVPGIATADITGPEKKSRSASVIELFRGGRGLNTAMYWTTFFCCLLMSYALGSWLPKLMISAGYGLGSSLTFLLIMNVGAIIGAIGGGWIGDRLNLAKVLVVFFAVAAACIFLLGYKSPLPVLYLLIAVTGATTIGSQILAYACVAQSYPIEIRSTGIGWASGIGRSGAIMGPLLGGALVSWEVSLQTNFIVFAIPGALAALAMAFVRRSRAAETTVVSSVPRPGPERA